MGRCEDSSSHNGFKTREGAAQAGFDDISDADTIVTQIVRPSTHASHFPDGSDIVEWMQERASDYGGEWGDDYLDDVGEAEIANLTERLAATLTEWFNTHQIKEARYYSSFRALKVHNRAE